MIRCVALRKTYGSVVAVNDLDLEIETGEVFGFLGPNGAGKTTTIRMMVGILAPTSGTVVLGGYDIREAPEAAKAQTGYVPDQPALYDKLTGVEFLRFMGGLYGVEREELEVRGADLLEEFGLLERAHELIETYSHGMKQRLTVAAALIHRPKILILDEPMVGMDPQGGLALRRLLTGLAASGVTIFLSTHSLGVAEELCDRIAILDAGRLVAIGSLHELRERAAERPELEPFDSSLEAVFLSLTGTSGGQV
ncbi:MAG: ABC transporter ATP-binding protein [Deltaproteobacteria bacterium]|nr:ABC transporter ATP-binding protein [Deltaproteobacteria bacterium]